MVMRERPAGGETYAYASEPKAIKHVGKAKYREDDAAQYPANIMFDRRVVRGNTYSAQILPAEAPGHGVVGAKPPQRRRKTTSRKPKTPPAVDGRRHMDIQTDAYLEELTDIVPESEQETQTDAFMDRPVTPIYFPQKTGTDAETQIEEGDLFDFDAEVEPILEVIVGKTLEQGLMEVMEEEELAAMRAHQEHFEQVRNMELVTTQKMEQAEKRKAEEKERRLVQEQERLHREKVLREKIAATTFARGYLTGMVSSVLDSLWDQGFFYDPVEREVQDMFLPWLNDAAQTHLENQRTARALMSSLLSDSLALRASSQSAADAQRRAQLKAKEQAEADAAATRADVERMKQEDVRGKASYILNELQPRCFSAAQIDAARQDLVAKAQTSVTEEYDAAVAKATEEAREKGEAMKAEAAARAAEAADGDDADAPNPTEDEIDIEKMVQEAVDCIQKPQAKEVTDADILSALIEATPELKDTILTNMATQQLGTDSWIHDARFAKELDAAPPAT